MLDGRIAEELDEAILDDRPRRGKTHHRIETRGGDLLAKLSLAHKGPLSTEGKGGGGGLPPQPTALANLLWPSPLPLDLWREHGLGRDFIPGYVLGPHQ